MKKIPSQIGGMGLVTLLVVAIVLLTPLLLTSPRARGEGLLPANTSIGGVSVGRMSPEDATQAVANHAHDLENSTIAFDLEGRFVNVRAADAGLTFDAAGSVDSVMAGRQEGSFPLSASLDRDRYTAHVADLESRLASPAVNASVTLDGITATAHPGKDGTSIDAEAYQAALLGWPQGDAPSLTVPISLGAPAISTDEAEDVAYEINAFFAQPVVLTAADLTWSIAPEDLAKAVHIQDDGLGNLAVVWDLDAVAPTIESVIGEIESTERADAWVQDIGSKSWLVPDVPDLTVDRKSFLDRLQGVLERGEHTVDVPVKSISADVTDESMMADMGITDLIATGTSVYTGSGIGRTHNIETATYFIDRTLIAPGGEYSFNNSVGSLFNGDYMSAGSYMDGPAGESIAGGVCQVSTTVFRAAMNAGFPIIERWPHSYRSVFYELGGWDPGYDASIVQTADVAIWGEGSDFRFQNPTDSWILVRASATDGALTVELWGAETGYDVAFTESDISIANPAPETITVLVDAQLPPGTMNDQAPLDGLDVWYTRTVTDANGELVLQDDWHTVYEATGMIRRVSPDMEEVAYNTGP